MGYQERPGPRSQSAQPPARTDYRHDRISSSSRSGPLCSATIVHGVDALPGYRPGGAGEEARLRTRILCVHPRAVRL
jgi:hypothetical protein